MGVFEDVVGKAKVAADYAGKKTGEIVEISKLRFSAADLQGRINKELQELGMTVYNSGKDATDFAEPLKEKTEIIDDLYAQLSKVNEKIAELRRMKKCPTCGFSNPEDANFCLKCGAKL
ncbi:MAG: zinc ribbon domain-containing protein [Clostridia bacterium]|nr:zinc ribbon domain-containing protein [Clostridia bacterium]MDR3644851.1 zinc ribbon domain-containing protein [Clostridia bacterium]